MNARLDNISLSRDKDESFCIFLPREWFDLWFSRRMPLAVELSSRSPTGRDS